MPNFGSERAGTGVTLYRGIHNRRRSVRQKVHLPAQAILTGKAGGKNNEPGEVLDLSENGACILTASPLVPDSHLTLSMDLVETNSFVATPGVVIWSDQRGRSGIYFDGIAETSRDKLKLWLIAKASANGGTETGPNEFGPRPVRSQPARGDVKRDTAKREFVKQSPEQTRAAIAASNAASTPARWSRAEPSLPSDYSVTMSALVAVKREVEAAGADSDKALQILADRALAMTHATGSAIALGKTKGATEMICRATAGSDAPGLGARLQVGFGFSGECVRAGKTLRCDDAESDPRVDRQGCRALGIRSIIASPVKRDGAVMGLLEVFSPSPNSFGPGEEKILERLAEMIATSVRGPETKPVAAITVPTAPVQAVQKAVPRLETLETPFHIEQVVSPASSHLRMSLYAALAVVVVIGGLWLILAKTNVKNLRNSPQTSSSAGQRTANPQASSNAPRPSDVESLRKLAAEGDPNAQFDMGARCATGEDVKQDYAESVRWFTMAAEQGHVIAQATLGAYYWAGRGIPQDLGKAYFWSLIAQAGGDAASRYRVTVLATRMPRSQVAAAEQQADVWLKKHQVPANPSE